ncbi:uncharacterized protein LOC143070684 isoform X1 [Mytilus galloprovincialis]|uniref:uncharacterized protein LOC143070684 isoform X1 n=2 Tax=Mytilus galloprovincialis TaxID=29158 RepID=UPI003F7BF310
MVFIDIVLFQMVIATANRHVCGGNSHLQVSMPSEPFQPIDDDDRLRVVITNCKKKAGTINSLTTDLLEMFMERRIHVLYGLQHLRNYPRCMNFIQVDSLDYRDSLSIHEKLNNHFHIMTEMISVLQRIEVDEKIHRSTSAIAGKIEEMFKPFGVLICEVYTAIGLTGSDVPDRTMPLSPAILCSVNSRISRHLRDYILLDRMRITSAFLQNEYEHLLQQIP